MGCYCYQVIGSGRGTLLRTSYFVSRSGLAWNHCIAFVTLSNSGSLRFWRWILVRLVQEIGWRWSWHIKQENRAIQTIYTGSHARIGLLLFGHVNPIQHTARRSAKPSLRHLRDTHGILYMWKTPGKGVIAEPLREVLMQQGPLKSTYGMPSAGRALRWWTMIHAVSACMTPW